MGLPDGVDAGVRDALHRVAVHVLGRRRHAVAGRFGLRPTPGGFGTPAFGEDVEVVRVAGGALVHERAGRARAVPLAGTPLAELASLVGADLSQPFAVGDDTPALGDVDAPLPIDPAGAAAVGAWYGFAAQVLDAAVVAAGADADATVAQLWPEHFDLALDLAWGPGEDQRVNLGASPGDASMPEPYLYVGPWGAERHGDPAWWNASFGATLTLPALRAAFDPHAEAVAFLRHGLTLLRQR